MPHFSKIRTDKLHSMTSKFWTLKIQFVFQTIFALVLICVTNDFVIAAESAGKIVLIKGKVFILDAKANIVADPEGKRGRKTEVGTEFFEGETISTKEGARVKLLFKEGANEVVLGSDTTLLVERAGDGAKKKGTSLNLSKGEVRSDVKIKYSGKGNEIYEVKSKNAVAGVRGTKFTAILNVKTASFLVATESGKVMVQSLLKNVTSSTMVMPGKFSVAGVDGVEPPKDIASDPKLASKLESLKGGSSSKDDDSNDSSSNGENSSGSAKDDGGKNANSDDTKDTNKDDAKEDRKEDKKQENSADKKSDDSSDREQNSAANDGAGVAGGDVDAPESEVAGPADGNPPIGRNPDVSNEGNGSMKGDLEQKLEGPVANGGPGNGKSGPRDRSPASVDDGGGMSDEFIMGGTDAPSFFNGDPAGPPRIPGSELLEKIREGGQKASDDVAAKVGLENQKGIVKIIIE